MRQKICKSDVDWEQESARSGATIFSQLAEDRLGQLDGATVADFPLNPAAVEVLNEFYGLMISLPKSHTPLPSI